MTHNTPIDGCAVTDSERRSRAYIDAERKYLEAKAAVEKAGEALAGLRSQRTQIFDRLAEAQERLKDASRDLALKPGLKSSDGFAKASAELTEIKAQLEAFDQYVIPTAERVLTYCEAECVEPFETYAYEHDLDLIAGPLLEADLRLQKALKQLNEAITVRREARDTFYRRRLGDERRLSLQSYREIASWLAPLQFVAVGMTLDVQNELKHLSGWQSYIDGINRHNRDKGLDQRLESSAGFREIYTLFYGKDILTRLGAA